MSILLIGIGGALGSILRYGFSLFFNSSLSVFLVNVVGSLIIGFLFQNFQNQTLNLFIIVGFLGGYTTFSSFSLEALKYYHSGQISSFFIYIFLTNIVSIGSCFLGNYLGQILQRA